jgi:hypothetical protein
MGIAADADPSRFVEPSIATGAKKRGNKLARPISSGWQSPPKVGLATRVAQAQLEGRAGALPNAASSGAVGRSEWSSIQLLLDFKTSKGFHRTSSGYSRVNPNS